MLTFNGKNLPKWLEEEMQSVARSLFHRSHQEEILSILLTDYINRKEAEIEKEKTKKPTDYGEDKSYQEILEDFGLGMLNKTMGFDDITIEVSEEIFDRISHEISGKSHIKPIWNPDNKSVHAEIYTAGGKIIIKKKQ